MLPICDILEEEKNNNTAPFTRTNVRVFGPARNY